MEREIEVIAREVENLFGLLNEQRGNASAEVLLADFVAAGVLQGMTGLIRSGQMSENDAHVFLRELIKELLWIL